MSASGDSGSGGPAPWRVRFAGTTYRVKDEASLRRLVETGKVPADAVVQAPDQQGWAPLGQVLAQPEAVDPWSAWEDLDEDAEHSVPPGGLPGPARGPAAPSPRPEVAASPPEEGLQVSMLPPDEEDDEDVGTSDSQVPLALDEAPVLPRAGVRSVAPPTDALPPPPAQARLRSGEAPAAPLAQPRKVIPFPGPRGGRPETEGAHALAAEPVPFPDRHPERQPLPPPPMDLGPLETGRRRGPAPPPQRRTNWWRVAALGALGLVVVGGLRMYVSMYTTPEYAPPVPQPAVPPGAAEHLGHIEAPAPAGGAEPGADAALDADTYRDIERDLRAHMMSGTQDATSADALETSLLIELNRIRLSVARVNVTVLSTQGGAEDAPPESVELRVVLRSDGQELDREIAAAALVVGKYVQTEDLAVPVFEVAFDGLADGQLLRKRIDAELARQFYLGRLPMADFLAALTR